MKNLTNKVAVITGAGGGIGRQLAIQLAKQGCRLALSDINKDGLQETADLLSGTDLSTHVVDVASLDQVKKFAAEVMTTHGAVDLIFNNAGVASCTPLDNWDYEVAHWVININLWGVVHMVTEFLPHLQAQTESHIINISSINGMIPFPTNGPYNMSKYAVLGWSETLMQELMGTSVRISVVHPGGINTNIANNAPGLEGSRKETFKKLLARTQPEDAAKAIVSGVKKNKRRIYVGADAKIGAFIKRIFPNWIVLETARYTNKLNAQAEKK